VLSGARGTVGSYEWRWRRILGWKGLTGGVHLIEREEREHDQLGRREPKRKTHFCGDAIDTWARWAGGAGWAKGQVGR
jgi:hypothetical protein